jgi:hypothetical protein
MENVTDQPCDHVTNQTNQTNQTNLTIQTNQTNQTNKTNQTNETNRLTADKTVGSSFSTEEGSQDKKLEGRKSRDAVSGVGSRPSKRTGTAPGLIPEIKKGTNMSGQLSDKAEIDQEDQINLGRLGGERDFKSKEFTDGEVALQEGVELDQGSPYQMLANLKRKELKN